VEYNLAAQKLSHYELFTNSNKQLNYFWLKTGAVLHLMAVGNSKCANTWCVNAGKSVYLMAEAQ